LISVLVFVSLDFELGRVSVQFANAFAIAITFARWRRRSEEVTTVPYGANFLFIAFMSNSALDHWSLSSSLGCYRVTFVHFDFNIQFKPWRTVYTT